MPLGKDLNKIKPRSLRLQRSTNKKKIRFNSSYLNVIKNFYSCPLHGKHINKQNFRLSHGEPHYYIWECAHTHTENNYHLPSLNIWDAIEFDILDSSLSHLHCPSAFEFPYGCSLSGVKASSRPWKWTGLFSILWLDIWCIWPPVYVLTPESAYCPCRLITINLTMQLEWETYQT